MKFILLSLLAFCCTFSKAQQAGSLDNTFDTDGITTIPIGNSWDIGKAVTTQADQKIIVAGTSSNGFFTDFALIRLLSNGMLDTTFNGSGKVTTPIGNENDEALSVAMQVDGKIVVAGYTRVTPYNDFAVNRYLTNGTLDSTFNFNGKVSADILNQDDYATSMLVQPDGKILIGGYSGYPQDYDFALARFNTDGTADTTFGINGKVLTDTGTVNDIAFSIALQTDGKIIAGGQTFNGNDEDFLIRRYLSNGTVDSTFGIYGKRVIPISQFNDNAHSIALQPDGKILAAGRTFDGLLDLFAITRLHGDGSIDTSFGTGGIVTSYIGTNNAVAYSINATADSKIIVCGAGTIAASSVFAVVRYTENGSLDTSFSNDGIVLNYIGTVSHARAATIQNNGRLLVVGDSYNGSDYDFAVARYFTGLNLGLVDFSTSVNLVLAYPNPVNQSTQLSFTLKEETVVSVELYNLEGRKILSFVENRKCVAGKNNMTLAFPETVIPGNYIIQLTALKSKFSVKIVLEK